MPIASTPAEIQEARLFLQNLARVMRDWAKRDENGGFTLEASRAAGQFSRILSQRNPFHLFTEEEAKWIRSMFGRLHSANPPVIAADAPILADWCERMLAAESWQRVQPIQPQIPNPLPEVQPRSKRVLEIIRCLTIVGCKSADSESSLVTFPNAIGFLIVAELYGTLDVFAVQGAMNELLGVRAIEPVQRCNPLDYARSFVRPDGAIIGYKEQTAEGLWIINWTVNDEPIWGDVVSAHGPFASNALNDVVFRTAYSLTTIGNAILAGGNTTEPTPICIHPDRLEVVVGKKRFSVTQAQCDILQRLLDAQGQWVSGKLLKASPGSRPDQVVNGLPKALKKLVESHRVNGYKLRVD